jgi:hypothetical protein
LTRTTLGKASPRERHTGQQTAGLANWNHPVEIATKSTGEPPLNWASNPHRGGVEFASSAKGANDPAPMKGTAAPVSSPTPHIPCSASGGH